MSDAVYDHDQTPDTTTQLPADLTADQLASAPTLASIDALIIEDLTEDEDAAFAAALDE